jgi:hypothetical protein
MSNELTVITKKVGKQLVFEKMEHTLENMQAKVGGYLEAVSLPMDITMWVNDSGLIDGLPLNLIIFVEGEEVHHICGDVIFTSVDDEGETISLNKEQMTWIVNKTKVVGVTRDKEGREQFVFGLFVR